ncbi:hypothetical protein O9K51_06971 [Purpureocillium lavendulum]|uniref:Uncharacterized protein n=1 Tax=Purpureocillium lavendulum TaxID=1247861 RepID=A0AB34FS60_9HYPO|nr:hypothetical protein O9K51_06971 [Purpureocillium lavendulum]
MSNDTTTNNKTTTTPLLSTYSSHKTDYNVTYTSTFIHIMSPTTMSSNDTTTTNNAINDGNMPPLDSGEPWWKILYAYRREAGSAFRAPAAFPWTVEFCQAPRRVTCWED